MITSRYLPPFLLLCAGVILVGIVLAQNSPNPIAPGPDHKTLGADESEKYPHGP